MSQTTNMNVFRPDVAVGDLDLNYFGGENVVTVKVDPTDTTNKFYAGQGVILKDCGADDVAGAPIAGVRSGDTIAIFGVRRRSLRQAYNVGGEEMEVAIKGAVMWFKASAALNRGVAVTLDTATPGNVKAQSTKAFLGYTLDKVAQNGMVRVMLGCDALTAGS